MTDLSWLDAIEARGYPMRGDTARLVKALRDAHAKLERVEALADDLDSWPSPYRGMPVAAEAIRAALAEEEA